MDPVLAIIIASGMTQTQFAIQLKENISTSAYLKNFDLMLEAVQSLHSFLESTKKFKSWASATDAAKKAFQKLEDAMRKCTGLLQRCISARSKLLQLVSEQALKKADFQQMCLELDGVLEQIPTETMPEVLCEQLANVRQRLQTTPFVEAITPEMKATFERLVKEEATGVRRTGPGAGPKFAAGQLAQQLGFEGQSSFRKEQEALALERRKAVEGRDKAQEAVLEQVAMVLVRMEKELPPYLEIQKLKAAALALPTLKPLPQRPAPAPAPAPPAANTMTQAQRNIVQAVEEQLSLNPNAAKDGPRKPDSPSPASLAGSPSQRDRDRRRTGAASSTRPAGGSPPSFQNWIVEKGQAGHPGHGSSADGAGSGRPGESRYARDAGSSGRGGHDEASEMKSPRLQPRPPQEPADMPTSRVVERVRKEMEEKAARSKEGPASAGAVGSRSPVKSSSDSKPRPFSSEEPARKREDQGSRRVMQEADAAADDGRDGLAGLTLSPDLGPETDLAKHHPRAAQQVVQSLQYGTAAEQSKAAGIVGLYTTFSPANRSTFREAGAVAALLPLVSSAQSGKTMEAAVGALLNLSSDDETKAELAAHLPELVQGVKRADTPAARSGMANILRNVASSSSETRAAAVDAGVVPHLIKLLNADDMSKQAAAEAIASLAKCESRRSTIVIQGAVMPLALALRSNPVPETLTAICSSLASLAAVPEGREAMGLGVPSLVNVLRLDIPDALKDAVEALLLLARHSPTYRSSIRNNGGMRYLRNVLRSGPPSLHPKAMELLAALFS